MNKNTLNRVLLYFIIIFTIFCRSAYAANYNSIIGQIPNSPEGLAGFILDNAIKIAGGIAFLLMVYGGFMFMNSAGEPNKLQEATDIIMAAIAGLFMIIFSIFILNFIGVKIFDL
jgi:hypothetical protein